MKEKVLYILKITGLSLIIVALLGYAVFAGIMADRWQREHLCTNFQVNILDFDKYQFICEDDILREIDKRGLNPVGRNITSNLADKIEKNVERINVVRRAECYISNKGDLTINLTQRVPEFKVVANRHTYYLDSDRIPLKANGVSVEITPLVTGYVSEELASGKLYDLVKYIQNNEFWNENIRVVNITPEGNIELYTNKGAEKLIINNLDTYQEKLELATLWYDQYTTAAWSERYTQVDLRYENLIFCKKGGKNE